MFCRFIWFVAFFAFSMSIGCTGGPAPLAQPEIPNDAGQSAVSKYDTDGDGTIGGAELDKVPALKVTLKRLDKNGDGKVNAEEIDQRIAVWKKSQIAVARVVATVLQNGRPLPGAMVTLVPEDFLGAAVKPATGTTDSTGSVHLMISDHPDEDGVHLGYYRVEISKKSSDGKETIPATFNSETTIGKEVTRDDPSSDALMVNIK